MKRFIFIGVFIMYTLFPIHIVYENKTDNTSVFNNLSKIISSSSKYNLLIHDNKISVYKNNSMLKEIKFEGNLDKFINSTIESKGLILFNDEDSYKRQYYIEISPNYIISSVPIDEKGNIIEDGRNVIVSEEDIMWMYENIPVETKVIRN